MIPLDFLTIKLRTGTSRPERPLPPFSYKITDGEPLPQAPFFFEQSHRFVIRKQLVPAGAGRSCTDCTVKLAQQLIDEPLAGVSDLFGLEVNGREVFGDFEPLPGHQLEQLIQELGGLPPALWINVAQQMLETTARVHNRGGIEVFFDPRRIFVWNQSGQILSGFAGCEFHTGNGNETREWVHWLRQLAIMWHYMATAEWIPQYYSLVLRKPAASASWPNKCAPISRFLNRLFDLEYKDRVFSFEKVTEALAECAAEIGTLEIPSAAMRLLNRAPTGRRCLAWMPPEEQISSNFPISDEERDPRWPTVFPAVEPLSGKSVFLHVLPPKEVAGDSLTPLHRQLDHLQEKNDPDARVLPVIGSWEVDGCRVYAESAPEGFALGHLLKRQPKGFSLPSVTPLAHAIHEALSDTEKQGLIVPSLNPSDVFVVPAEPSDSESDDFGWLSNPAAYSIRLRAIPTGFLHRRDPAHLRNPSRGMFRFLENARFAELVSRLLNVDELKSPAVGLAITQAITRGMEGAGARRREQFLADLVKTDIKASRQHKKFVRPRRRRKLLKAVAAVAFLGAGLGFGAAVALRDGHDANLPASNIVEKKVSPPKNLLPVSRDADPDLPEPIVKEQE